MGHNLTMLHQYPIPASQRLLKKEPLLNLPTPPCTTYSRLRQTAVLFATSKPTRFVGELLVKIS